MSSCGWCLIVREAIVSPSVAAPTGAVLYNAEKAMRERSEAVSSRLVIESPKSKMHAVGTHEVPLAKGSVLPPLDAPGWLHGVPTANDLDRKVLVVDVWDGGCPYCSMSEPTLIRVYEHYRDQGVFFLGLTSADIEDARTYVDYLKVPWPNAYDAGPTIDKLGANAPTVFVVGSDGRVLWNDSKARFKHEVSEYGERLEQAIDHALSLPRESS